MSDTTLLIGTGQGLFKAHGNGHGYSVTPTELTGGGLRCPVVVDNDDPKLLFAGTSRAGMFRSGDQGQTWQAINNGLDKQEIWYVAQHPQSGELWAGVSPSAVYKSVDRGESWTECKQLQSLPSIKEWTFPQPPHISHVKHMSLRPDDPDHVLGAIEEGWIVRSKDGGETWENLRNGCEFDAHTVYYMPDNPDVIVTTSGTGVYRSEDGGQSFVKTMAGLDRRYMTHLVQHPERPNVVFTAAAEVPPPGWSRPEGGNSAFYRSEDQGRTWRRLTNGFPELMKPAPRCAAGDPDNPDRVFFGLTDASVWATEDGGDSFKRLLDLTSVLSGDDWRANAVTSIRVAHSG
jgi:photosystem II stability/assembly factor-like uncharacterized protein